MKPFATIVTILTISLFWLPTIEAQTSFNQSDDLESVTGNLLNLEADDWTFLEGENGNTFFIDFEKIKSNLNEIKVMNQNGETVFEDELWNLPVDTIYELDFTDFKKGKYAVKITTFTEEINKTITIN